MTILPDSGVKSTTRKSWVAALLSLVTIGLGHLYCGRPRLAAIAFLITFGVGYLGFVFVANTDLIWLGLGLIGLESILWLIVLPVHAALLAHRTTREYSLRSYNRWYYYLSIVLCMIGFSLYVEPMFVDLEAYGMPTTSMENQIMNGDYILVDNSSYQVADPERGDVVVLVYPGDGVTKYVKRIVGLPGDTVEVVDGTLYVNSVQEAMRSSIKYVDTTATGERNIRPRRPGGQHSRDNFGPYVVPKDSYFMLGDNRDNSADSRFWGPVHRDLILSQVLVVHWSSDLSRIGLRVD